MCIFWSMFRRRYPLRLWSTPSKEFPPDCCVPRTSLRSAASCGATTSGPPATLSPPPAASPWTRFAPTFKTNEPAAIHPGHEWSSFLAVPRGNTNLSKPPSRKAGGFLCRRGAFKAPERPRSGPRHTAADTAFAAPETPDVCGPRSPEGDQSAGRNFLLVW